MAVRARLRVGSVADVLQKFRPSSLVWSGITTDSSPVAIFRPFRAANKRISEPDKDLIRSGNAVSLFRLC